MIGMMNAKVTTNIRMDRDDWLNIKAIAAAKNMSFNEYINWLVRDWGAKKELAVDGGEGKKRRQKVGLMDFSRKIIKDDKPMGLSKDDELIYG